MGFILWKTLSCTLRPLRDPYSDPQVLHGNLNPSMWISTCLRVSLDVLVVLSHLMHPNMSPFFVYSSFKLEDTSPALVKDTMELMNGSAFFFLMGFWGFSDFVSGSTLSFSSSNVSLMLGSSSNASNPSTLSFCATLMKFSISVWYISTLPF